MSDKYTLEDLERDMEGGRRFGRDRTDGAEKYFRNVEEQRNKTNSRMFGTSTKSHPDIRGDVKKLIISFVVIVLVATVAGLIVYFNQIREYEVKKSVSEDGEFSVVFQTQGKVEMDNLVVYFEDSKGTIKTYDGFKNYRNRAVKEDDFEVVWKEDRVEVIFKSEFGYNDDIKVMYIDNGEFTEYNNLNEFDFGYEVDDPDSYSNIRYKFWLTRNEEGAIFEVLHGKGEKSAVQVSADVLDDIRTLILADKKRMEEVGDNYYSYLSNLGSEKYEARFDLNDYIYVNRNFGENQSTKIFEYLKELAQKNNMEIELVNYTAYDGGYIEQHFYDDVESDFEYETIEEIYSGYIYDNTAYTFNGYLDVE